MTFELDTPDIGAWREGNVGIPGVWRFQGEEPGRHAMVTALVHGNELCGAWALKGLLEAGLRPRRGSLTLAFCNLAAFDTFDPQNHDASRFVEQDMNRQWSDDRMAAADTAERRRVAQLAPVVAQADWLLDLHSMHEPSPPLTLTGMAPQNVALAVQMGAPVHIVVDAGHKDGVRMRDYGRFGDPAAIAAGVRSLLVECGYHGALSSRDVAQDQCIRFLALSGCFDDGECDRLLPGWRLPDAPEQWVLDVTEGVVAKTDTVRFSEPFQGLEVIAQAGTVIGENDGPIRTPYDDCVLVMPSLRQARTGVTVVRFARRRKA